MPADWELAKAAIHSAGLGENGMMMAGDGATTYLSGSCNGSTSGCRVHHYQIFVQTLNATYYGLYTNVFGFVAYDSGTEKLSASVRCVKDME